MSKVGFYSVLLYIFYRGHHILLFLTQTVARQASEHEQYIPNRMSSSTGGGGGGGSGGSGTSSKQRLAASNRGKTTQIPPIEHEQEPPKFSKISLTFILKNWNALKSMIMFGCSNTGARRYVLIYFASLRAYSDCILKKKTVFKSYFALSYFAGSVLFCVFEKMFKPFKNVHHK